MSSPKPSLGVTSRTERAMKIVYHGQKRGARQDQGKDVING
jgi:hypothetical protein